MDEKKLISLVERNPVVFNVMHEFFTCFAYKNKVWNKIGEQLGTTGEMCRKTWTKIRNRYLGVRAHRKSINRQPHEIIHKWHHEDEMEFYAKYLTKRHEIQSVEPYISVARNCNRVLGTHSSKNQPDQPTNRNDDQQIQIDDDTEDFVQGFDGSSEDENEWTASKDDDVLKTFFDAMFETVNGFSDRTQHTVKERIFSIVSKLEQRELDFKALAKA